jgi:hypothetical protein
VGPFDLSTAVDSLAIYIGPIRADDEAKVPFVSNGFSIARAAICNDSVCECMVRQYGDGKE